MKKIFLNVKERKEIILLILLVGLMLVLLSVKSFGAEDGYADLTITPFITARTVNFGEIEYANELETTTKGLTISIDAYPKIGNTNATPIFGLSVSFGTTEHPKSTPTVVYPKSDKFTTFSLTIGLRF